MGVKLKEKTCSVCNGNGKVMTNHGAVRIVTDCRKCKGFGREVEHNCKECNGSGKKMNVQELKINIPAGIRNGTILQVERDLEMVVYFTPHKDFSLINNGCDVGSRITIDLFDAVFGNSVNVNTLSGIKKLKISAGIQPNTILKINGGGFKEHQNGRSGDHFVEVGIKIPTELTEEQTELFTKLKNSYKKQ
jgi:molecular chaperone DnaJ